MPQSSPWNYLGPLALLICLMARAAPTLADSSAWEIPHHPPAPADNEPSAARIELGRMLFFDPRLSGKGTMSCASCHNPALGWTDGLPRAFGFDMKPLPRATPTIVNASLNDIQMWDGRKPTLEEQALGPFLSPDEMNLPADLLEARVHSIAGYAPYFARAYPDEAMTASTVAKAIASFERTIVSTDSPFDEWQRGDEHAVSAAAKHGFELFTGKAHCNLCHLPPNFTDSGFHNIGLNIDRDPEDVGRFAHRKVAVLKGAFKTPTLRDVSLTAPYMHNGEYATLEAVVDHYDRGGDVRDNLDRNMQPLQLSAQEKADLVAFMKTLTGKHHAIDLPQLPQ